MIDININNASEYTVSGKYDIESDCIGIKNTLRFVLDKEPLTNVLYWMAKDRKINEQTLVRSHPELYKGKRIVEVPTAGRGRTVNQEAAAEAYLSNMTEEQRLVYLSKKTGIPLEQLKALQAPSVEKLS